MKEIANVEYFFEKCNELLETAYTAEEFGGVDVIKKSINLEWLASATAKVYNDIHHPLDDCRLLLSSRFNPTASKIALTKEVVNSIINYLRNFNKECVTDCHCPSDKNCNCVCSSTCSQNCGYMGNCSSSACTCNCGSTTIACACACNCNCPSSDCGNDAECQCDCDPYACNCDKISNLSLIPAKPMIENCTCGPYSNCPCACECYTACPHSRTSSTCPSTTCPTANCPGHSRTTQCPTATCAPSHSRTDNPPPHNKTTARPHSQSHNNSHQKVQGDSPKGPLHSNGHAQGYSKHSNGGSGNATTTSGGNSSSSGSTCFTGSTLVTMEDGSKKRIDQIKVGDYVMTTTGGDKVISIEQGFSPSWRIKIKNGPSITTSSTHPFLLKNHKIGMIDPNGNQTEFNAIFQATKLEPGIVLWSDHVIESIEKTGVTDYLYNLILENSVFYFVEDIVCMTPNTYAAYMIMLLADKFDPNIFKDEIKIIRTFMTDEMKQKFLTQIIDVCKSIINDPENPEMYLDCSRLSQYFNEMLLALKEDTIMKNLIHLSNYTLICEEKRI